MKKILVLALCLMMVFAATASAKELSEIKIGYILKTESNEYWATEAAGVEAWAAEKGVQVDVQFIDDETNFSGQLEIMENMVNMGYDAIVASPLSSNNLVNGVIKASEEGVVVVNNDEGIDLEAVIAGGGNMAGYVATNNIDVGNTAGKFIVETIGEGKVAIISGTDGNTTSNQRTEGAKEILDAAEGIEVVSIQNGDWDRQIAMDVATNILTTYPDLKAFYCANDNMALGVYEAVVNADLTKQCIVVGTDAIAGAKESVKDGGLAATVGQDNIGLGVTCGEIAIQCVLDGWKADPTQDQCQTTYVDCFLVTPENVDQYL